MITNITKYFTYKSAYKQVLTHLERIIDYCGYNDNAAITLFSKGDFYADEYYYDLIYIKEIRPDWMGWLNN